jgi:SAM-dependent methyltransferase
MLRIARTRRGAQAVVADALALPLADGAADAVILAYVLFHLADPSIAVAEAARVLRPAGRVGTITWAWEQGPTAQTLWDQVLTKADAPPGPLRRVDAGLDRPEAVKTLLRSAGLRPERTWRQRLHHQWDPSSFGELAAAGAQTGFGSAASTPAPATVCWPARKAASAGWPRQTFGGKAKSSAPQPPRTPPPDSEAAVVKGRSFTANPASWAT